MVIVTHNQEPKRRIVTAPQPSLSLYPNVTNIASILITVELNEDESVDWIWTIYPNGQNAVTGYNIIMNNS